MQKNCQSLSQTYKTSLHISRRLVKSWIRKSEPDTITPAFSRLASLDNTGGKILRLRACALRSGWQNMSLWAGLVMLSLSKHLPRDRTALSPWACWRVFRSLIPEGRFFASLRMTKRELSIPFMSLKSSRYLRQNSDLRCTIPQPVQVATSFSLTKTDR